MCHLDFFSVPIPVQCLSRLQKPREGLELIDLAIKLDPKMPVARFNKAITLTAIGQLEVGVGRGRYTGGECSCERFMEGKMYMIVK